jgi:DNA-binding transcriptional LysR family regulator
MEPHLLDGRLKMRHLVLVDALTEQGSLVGAASQLHVTQPALTRALRELEEILGVTLYERGPRGAIPTLYGAAFTEHARAVLAQLAQAGRHVAELASAERGTVAVGTHLAGSNLLLPRAIAALKAEHPRVTVVIREGTPEALLADLDAGRVDLVVGRITGTADPATTRSTVLYDEPIRLVARVGHPAGAAAGLTIADLLAYPWILPGPQTALRHELEQVFARHDLPLPENRIESTSILTMRSLLVHTDVVAALPMLIATEDARIGVLPVALEPMSHTVGITRPAHRQPSPSTAVLLAHLEQVAAEIRPAVRVSGRSRP